MNANKRKCGYVVFGYDAWMRRSGDQVAIDVGCAARTGKAVGRDKALPFPAERLQRFAYAGLRACCRSG